MENIKCGDYLQLIDGRIVKVTAIGYSIDAITNERITPIYWVQNIIKIQNITTFFFGGYIYPYQILKKLDIIK